MEAVVVQDNGIETSHGTTMRDVSMDDGAITMEGAEACQGELAVEDGSVSNRAVDADRAQARGAEKVIGAQGIQVAGGNGSMASGGIVGAGAQLGAAENVKAGTFAMDPAPANNKPDKPENWGSMSKSQRRHWFKRKLGREDA